MEVAEAMSMNNMRKFINLDTLEVNMHPAEDHFFFEDMEDTAKEAIENPDKLLAIEILTAFKSFRIMKAFAETVKVKGLQRNLIQALERKKPFSNFKHIIDNSPIR